MTLTNITVEIEDHTSLSTMSRQDGYDTVTAFMRMASVEISQIQI